MNKNSLKAIVKENVMNCGLSPGPKNRSKTHKILFQERKVNHKKTKKIKSPRSLSLRSNNDLKIRRIINPNNNKNILLKENSFEYKDSFDYEYYIKSKIKELEINCINAKRTIQKQLKDQQNAYKDEIWKIKEVKFACSPDKMRISKKNDCMDIDSLNNEEYIRGKNNSFHSKTVKVLKSKRVSMTSFCSNNNKNIDFTGIFENYFKKFHFFYFQSYAEKNCFNTIQNANENYKDKLQSYIYFEDQIKELELLTTGDTENIEQKLIIENMIKAIILERKLKILELEKSNLNNNNTLILTNKNSTSNNHESYKWCHINEDFLNKFIEMFR